MSNEKKNSSGNPANSQSKPLERSGSGRINEGKTVGQPTPKKK